MCVPTFFLLVTDAEGRSHSLTPSFLAAPAAVQQAILYLCGEARVIYNLWTVRVAVYVVVDTIMRTAQLAVACVSFFFSGRRGAPVFLWCCRCHQVLLSPADTSDTVCTTGYHPVCVQKQNSPTPIGLHSILSLFISVHV